MTATEARKPKSVCPSGKERFRDRYTAERRLFRYQMRRRFPLKRAYPCPYCKGWHLTSQP